MLAGGSQLDREPLGDDLRAGVAIERGQGAIDGAERVRARSPGDARASDYRSPVSSGLASTRWSAPAFIASRSRSIEAISRSTIATSSRGRSFFEAAAVQRRGRLHPRLRVGAAGALLQQAHGQVAEHRQVVVDEGERLAEAAVGERRRLAAACSLV